MRRWLLLALLLGSPGLARADTLYWLGAKLPNGATFADGGGDPMKYFVDETQGSPGGLPVASVESEIRAAYQRWEDVDCAYIGFSFEGAITDPAQLGNHADTRNVMGSFVDARTDPRYTDDLGNGVAVGVALTYKLNGVIAGCDTEFNHFDYRFGDDGSSGLMDFPSLSNHENGHCLGLDHDPNDFQSVMYPSVNPGDLRRALDAHDRDNVCQLYPETGALGSPCAGASCASGLSCIANPTAGGNFCSQGCVPQDPATCPAGFGCRASSAVSGAAGACFPGAGDVSPTIGGPCSAPADCKGASALCFTASQNGFPGGYCSQYCDSLQCPTGTVCVNGGAHLFCASACKTSASPGATGSCRSGYACDPFDTGGDGFCYPACTSDASCGGGLHCQCDGVCYPPGSGESFVGHPCLSVNDCPTGDFCVPAAVNGQSTGWTGGYCVAPCGGGQNSCRGCPVGSSCVVAGAEGESYCLQDCAAQSGCRTGYACSSKPDTSHGTRSVCTPPQGCQGDGDCPVGERCQGGACIDPYADGGATCTLCGDGGSVASSGGGSTGSGGDKPATPGGCGCGSGSGSLFEGLMVAAGALVRARRRRW
jgi:hypothetical protein